MGEWLELVGDALREIRGHKLRSLLTLSGIVFGAASLVSLASLAGGLREMAFEDIRTIGYPRSYWIHDREPRSDVVAAADVRHPGLRIDDLDALRAIPGVESVQGQILAGERLVAGPRDWRVVWVAGVDAGYAELRHFRIQSGRTLRANDIAFASRVAVLGAELAGDLFGSADPVGRVVTVGGVRFTVVGVVRKMPIGFIPADFSNLERRVYLPYSYFTRYEEGEHRVESALVTVRPDADVAAVVRAGEVLIRQRHGVRDFEIENEAADTRQSLAMADNILGGWNSVMYVIAIVTLLVGGIGLFSVLLISVRERVREIGIRKALGADDGDILRLFLAESLTLAVLGAVIGVAGGAGLIMVTKAIGAHFGRDFTIPLSVPGVLFSLGFSLVVGLVFGWYPARRAAKLDPIEAIGGV